MSEYRPSKDLTKALDAIAAKRPAMDTLDLYDRGIPPLKFSADKIKRIFPNLTASWSISFPKLIIDTIVDRMRINQFSVEGNDNLTDTLNEFFQISEFDLDFYSIIRHTVLFGEAFAVAQDDPDTLLLDLFQNDPRNVHAEYDGENPRRMIWAAKLWKDTQEGVWRANLFYPDRIERYIGPGYQQGFPTGGGGFRLEEDIPNPYDPVIPVWHFRKELHRISSELTPVLSLVDGINLLASNMMVASEFAAHQQRYVISNAADVGELKNAPNTLWNLPAGDGVGQGTQVGTFPAADMANYTEAINNNVDNLLSIAGLPRSIVMNEGSFPSGAALRAAEVPLLAKVERYANTIERTFRQLAVFVLARLGSQVDPLTVNVQWDPFATSDLATDSQTLQQFVGAGVPLPFAARMIGFSDAEVESLSTEIEAEQQRQADLASAYLDMAERNANAAGANVGVAITENVNGNA